MSMKKFLSRHRKSTDVEDTLNETSGSFISHPGSASNRHSVSTTGSKDSIGEAKMFDNKIQNDASLNLNPSILNNNNVDMDRKMDIDRNVDAHLNAMDNSFESSKPTSSSGSNFLNFKKINPSIFTKDSSVQEKSIFSNSNKTFSTNQSSHYSSGSQHKLSLNNKNLEYGQRLQILEAHEELNERNPKDLINEKLRQLSDDMSFATYQYNNSALNLTSAVINTIDCLKNFVSFVESLSEATTTDSWSFNTYNNIHLRKVMKIYLNFYDNLLQDEVYIKLKLLLVRNFNDFSNMLTNASDRRGSINPTNIVKPQNFAIGCNENQRLPNEDVLINIIQKMASTSVKIKEQNGSFIAPIVRGIAKDMNVLCLYFGYPNPSDYHTKLTQSLHDLYDDIHVVVVKNQIDLAATKSMPTPGIPDMASHAPQPQGHSSDQPQPPLQKFKLPFRVPSDVEKPTMSLSISIENASRTSGTMGGFIYPMIDLEKQPHLESYSNSKFAISCGHVCLNNGDDQTEYPHVSAPSSVLISLYKKALIQQYEKLSRNDEDSTMMEAKVAYGSVLKQVDRMFPLKKVKITNGKTKQAYYETRNLPIHRFGQIIWGERTLMSMKDSNEKKLSDLAIIKVNKNLTCNQNFLGDDIAFNEFDPGLMFDNLYVRKVIDLERYAPKISKSDLNINEVDDTLPVTRNNNAGLPVFKYGSTTKYTQGNLNGIKLVYWLDGAMHSSEFVINSIDNNTAFAAGGDSGSWILSKLEDCNTVSESKGLGVLGMLHSYDGEFRQFGLFTPMCEILTRLEEVTKIKWGVVGVSDKDNSNLPNDVDSESDLESVSSLSGSDQTDNEYEGAMPPEID